MAKNSIAKLAAQLGFLFALTIALCVMIGGSEARAQTTGTIFGTAKDPSGALLPGVNITVSNEATGLRRAVVTDDRGDYIVSLLPVGAYTVEAELAGFKRFSQKGINLSATENVRVDIVLELGEITEAVEVVGATPLIETRSAALGKIESQARIVELPLNGRNFLQLGMLQPGVAPPLRNIRAMTVGNTPGGVDVTFHVNGLRQSSNNFLLDGADNNEVILGTAGVVPVPDALQEFRILTNMYSAEFGRGGGSIVNIITRSGTNSFRGSIYEFLRNDVLDARNFFVPDVPKLRRNQFGGVVGGPVRRDRVFFLFSYEGLRQRRGVPTTATVPSLKEREGDFSDSPAKPTDFLTGGPFPGNRIPSERFDPVARNVLSLYRLPNTGLNQFSTNANESIRRDQFTIKIDHILGEKDTFTARYIFDDGFRVNPIPLASITSVFRSGDFPAKDANRWQNAMLAETHTFSANLVNEFRFAFRRNRIDALVPVNPLSSQPFGFRFPQGEPIVPMIIVAGLDPVGNPSSKSSFPRANSFQWFDTISYQRGAHNIKAGVEVGHHQVNTKWLGFDHGSFIFLPVFTGNAFADFLLGKPLIFFTYESKTSDRYYRSTGFHWYIQDEYKMTPKFTLNLGLRYELDTPAVEMRDRIATFIPGAKSRRDPTLPVGVLLAGDPGVPRATIVTDKNNFAPRFGFAWDPTGGGKMSLRAGYGIFYDTPAFINIMVQGLLIPSKFPVLIVPLVGGTFADPTGGVDIFGPSFPFGQELDFLSPDARTPYVQQWNLTIQREFGLDTALEVAYVGNKASKLTLSRNLGNPLTGLPDLVKQTAALLINNCRCASSNYNGLQISVTKRPSQGLAFLGSYSLSKAIDHGSQPYAFIEARGQQTAIQNPNDLGAERGLAAFDVRQRFVFSFLWQLPFLKNHGGLVSKVFGGWQLSGILTFQSGQPFTVLDLNDPDGDFDLPPNNRTDLVGNPNLPSSQRRPERWFNTQAFQPVPRNTRFGNAGRNIAIADGINNFDFSLIKRFRVAEGREVEFRSEFFNLFNHPNFGIPEMIVNSPNFGKVIETSTPSREIQFALKLIF